MKLCAKLAYLLCTCSKFNDSFMAAMSKQYEKNKIIATRHYFTFYINLTEPTTVDYNDKFAIDTVDFTFAGSSDIVICDALQYHNNNVLTDNEMIKIYNNIKVKNIKIDAIQIVGIYTIASLIKYYKNMGFKYIFIPVVINYGRDSSSVHQAALIIDFTGKFLFYEPYGKYVKYDKSYSECVCDLFNIFNINTLFDNTIECITYHNYLNLDEGIQNILLTSNNNRRAEFDIEYNNIISDFNKEFPEYNIEPQYSENEIDRKDHTAKILDLLFNIDHLYSKIKKDNTKKQIYNKIFYRILEQYCCYNSKTCVTITLVELNEFFKYSNNSIDTLNNSNNSIDTLTMSNRISKLYDEFKIDYPNSILMTKLCNLLSIFNNSSDIKEVVDNATHLSGICNKLFKKPLNTNNDE